MCLSVIDYSRKTQLRFPVCSDNCLEVFTLEPHTQAFRNSLESLHEATHSGQNCLHITFVGWSSEGTSQGVDSRWSGSEFEESVSNRQTCTRG